MQLLTTRNRASLLILLFLASHTFLHHAYADEGLEESSDSTATSEEDCLDPFPENYSIEEPPAKAFFSFLDTSQRTISSGVKGLAQGIDEFFANEKVYYESTGSYIRLTADTIWEEGGNIGYAGDIRIKLRLPRTQKKLKFTFESDPDEKRDGIERTTDTKPRDAAKEKSYFAGIQADLGKKEKWQIKPSIGVKIRSPLDVYLRLRVNRTYNFINWKMYLAETLYWFDSTGTGFDTSVELDRRLDDDLLFRSASFGRWTNENDYWDLSQVFSITHTLSQRRAITYQAGVYGTSEPTIFATDYLLAVRYRQNIHSNFLFMELVPQILYQKENDFRAEHSFLFRIEMVFQG